MPTFAELRVPPPKSWDAFEAIVCSAAKSRWKSADFSQHGRQGQRQDGVDVYGKDDRGRLVGLQCKNTWTGLAQGTITDEVEKAQSFKPQLEQLYVVTTADTDKILQAFVRGTLGATAEGGTFRGRDTVLERCPARLAFSTWPGLSRCSARSPSLA
jgi:hypothetical protein